MNRSLTPLVSVIIPTFNAQEWIAGLLESIVNQSYQNIEVIIVNDGSTDESLAVISKFLQTVKDFKVQVITQENRGVSFARNEGVRISSGELLAFVDSDDIWLREKIDLQVKSLKDSGFSAAACSYAIFRDSDLQILDVVHPDWSLSGVRNWLLFRSYGGLLSSTLMITREAFHQAGPFRTDLSLSADIEFAWRLLNVTKVKLITKPVVGYRLRPNQMHKLPDLLLTEAQRMLKIIDLLQTNRFKGVFLSNLNLRLFLYCLQERKLDSGFRFLLKAIRGNAWETFCTLIRIISKRFVRRLKIREKKSFLLPGP